MAALVLLASASSAWGLPLLQDSTRLGGSGRQPRWQPPAGAGQDKVLRSRLRSILESSRVEFRQVFLSQVPMQGGMVTTAASRENATARGNCCPNEEVTVPVRLRQCRL